MPLVLQDDGCWVEIEDNELERPEDDTLQAPDDFDDLLARRALAGHSSSGMPVDDLEQEARFRQSEHDEQKGRAAHVRTNPETAHRGLLGGSDVAEVGKSPKQVIFWEGDDIEALPVTITFGPREKPLPTQTGIIRPFVRIYWGTRDGKFSCDIDAALGGQVTLGASAIYVSVGLDDGSTVNYNLSASLAFYTALRGSPIFRTRYVDEQAAAAVVRVERPEFSITLYDFQRSDPTAQYTLNFYSAAGVLLYSRIVAGGQYLAAPIGLSNDVAYINVTNQGQGVASCRLMFGLAL